MQALKTFLITFFSSVCVVLLSFLALYWSAGSSQKAVDATKNDIPVAKAEVEDSKTTLILADFDSSQLFVLLKLNAIGQKITVATIPADYYFAASDRTLSQSFEYAGMMQCVQDMCDEFGIKIDYHLVLNKENLDMLTASFSDITAAEIAPFVPQDFQLDTNAKSIKIKDMINFFEQNSPLLDNTEWQNFAAALTRVVVKNNISNIQNYTLTDIKNDFSYMLTNIGTQQAARLDRILSILSRTDTVFTHLALTDSSDAKQQIMSLFG